MKNLPKNMSKTDLYYKLLGIRISVERQKIGLSQDVLAHALGVSRISISSIEGGKWHSRLSTVEKICDVLQIDFFKLINLKPTEVERYVESITTGVKNS